MSKHTPTIEMRTVNDIVRILNAHDDLVEALRAIVERSNIEHGNVDPLGTVKITDMRYIAAKALAKHGGEPAVAAHVGEIDDDMATPACMGARG